MSKQEFKNYVNKRELQNPVLKIQYTRQSHVLMARLRCGNADLRENLYNRNLADYNLCPNCGLKPETVHHYFVECREYDNLRRNICLNVSIETWNLDSIFYGSKRYDNELNELLQITAQRFIVDTKRFKSV